VFITRATRREYAEVTEFLTEHERGDADLTDGVTFIAREGAVLGCVSVVEVEPRTLVVDNVLVHAERRGEGVGKRLMETALNSRGGTLYLACHDDVIPFYAKIGFAVVSLEDAPPAVVDYWAKVGDIPSDPHHVHYYMKAR
jgi:N-acetylglutamate synthase-like GNAT family acetyltransferase